jgi:hypothetical protein
VETAIGLPENEKWCVDISRPRRFRIYVSRRSHRMQKHKFSVRCPGSFLWKPQRAHPSMKNSVSTFCTVDALDCIV